MTHSKTESSSKATHTGRVLARLAVLLALCLSATPAHAQYRFDHWTADDSLPQNSVRDIKQTRDGYLWFTTFDGLVRFDGVRFTVFDKSNSPGIASNRFLWLFEDGEGDLWATLETGEVVRRRKGRFQTYTREHGLTGDPNPWLVDDGQGNVVVVSYQFGLDAQENTILLSLHSLRWSDDRFVPLEDPVPSSWPSVVEVESPPKPIPFVVEQDYWVLRLQEVIRYKRSGEVAVYGPRNGLPGQRPRLIWGKRRPEQLVSRDGEGRVWVTDLASMRNRLLSQSTPEGFEEVLQGYVDDEGNYWFSTFSRGLFRARPQTITPYGKAQGVDAQEIYPVLETRDGSIWIGSGTEGLYRLEDGVVTHYAPTSFLGGEYGSSLYEDRSGQLWVNGYARFVDGRFLDAPWKEELRAPSAGLVWTMYEDHEGAYWIGTDFGVFRHQNGVTTRYTTEHGLAGNSTKVIVEDVRGGLWIGSYGGLTHYREGTFTAWTEKDGLPGSTVRALRQDADGTLWIGTYDSGLCRFKDGRFTSYTTKDGMYDNGVFQILEDDAGWFWMSCNRGIYRVRKQDLNELADGRLTTLTCLAYNKSDGMPSSECNGGRWPAGIRSRDGKLWFPTMGGVAMIDPASVKADSRPPPVVIEQMRVNNEPVPYDVWESALRDPLVSIRVEPGQDNFEIEYTALSFVNSENLRFRYKLEGADHDWVEAGTRRTAYYSYVPPGEYTFRVIAANADGVWNETGAGVRVTVLPPFYRTWWFTTLALAGVAGVALVWHSRRLARLRREHAAQAEFSRRLMESHETERRRIAAELHDSLGQSLAIIKNRALLGLRKPLDGEYAQEQLREIADASADTIDEVKEIARSLRPYQLDRLGLTRTIEGMIEKISNTHDIRFSTEVERIDGLLPSAAETNVFRIVQESLNNVLAHAEATEVDVCVKRNAKSVEITVRDNGKGFVAEAPGGKGSPRQGFGLVGMAERARQIGGAYAIRSTPGQGTTMTLTLKVEDVTRER